MKRLSVFFLLFAILLSLGGCSERRGAREMLSKFADCCDVSGVLYSPDIKEGEAGYIDSGFFEALYDASPDPESDYAVFLSASLDKVYEAAVFVCFDESSAFYAEEICRKRLLMIEKMGYGGERVLIRRRGTVFYSVMPKGVDSEAIWRDIEI